MNDSNAQDSAVVGRIERPGQVDAQVTVDAQNRIVVIEQRQTPFSIQPDTVRLPFDAIKTMAAQIMLMECAGNVQVTAGAALAAGVPS